MMDFADGIFKVAKVSEFSLKMTNLALEMMDSLLNMMLKMMLKLERVLRKSSWRCAETPMRSGTRSVFDGRMLISS